MNRSVNRLNGQVNEAAAVVGDVHPLSAPLSLWGCRGGSRRQIRDDRFKAAEENMAGVKVSQSTTS